MKKATDIILTIFSVGVLVTLFIGGLTMLGYVVALCIGGETATAICVFIHKSFFPWLIRFTSVFVGVGLIGMYLSKMKALTFSGETKQDAESKTQSFSENEQGENGGI